MGRPLPIEAEKGKSPRALEVAVGSGTRSSGIASRLDQQIQSSQPWRHAQQQARWRQQDRAELVNCIYRQLGSGWFGCQRAAALSVGADQPIPHGVVTHLGHLFKGQMARALDHQ